MVNLSHRVTGIITAITGAATFGFLVLPYMLFPEFYIAKSNPSMGYTSPATVEGWAFTIVGVAMLLITVVMAKLYRSHS